MSLYRQPMRSLLALPHEQLEEHLAALSHLAPRSELPIDGTVYLATPLGQLTFARITGLRNDMEELTADRLGAPLSPVYGLPANAWLQADCVDFLAAFNHLRKSLERLHEQERDHWQCPSDPLFDQAEENQLKPFGPLNITAMLAERYHATPLQVEQWPYDHVFVLFARCCSQHVILERYRKLLRHDQR